MFVLCLFKSVNRKVLFLKMKLSNYFLITENVVFFIWKKPGIMFHAVSLRVCKHMIIHVADFYALRFPAVEFYWLMFSLIKKKPIILFYSSLFAHRNPILRPKRSPGSHRQRETGARESWLVGEETGTYKSACFCSLMKTKSSVLWAYWIIFTVP